MHRGRRGQSGSALVVVMIIMVVVIVLCVATLALSSAETKSATIAKRRIQALYVAEAGLELQIQALKEMREKAGLVISGAAIDALAGCTTYAAEPLVKDGASIGQFTVSVTAVEVVDGDAREVTIRSQGFVPSADAPHKVARTVTATARPELGRSGVFDYVYFTNNWGRFRGDDITANGNTGANGPFDSAAYSPTIDGVPRYQRLVGTDLQGYLDDNGDGIEGNDGGIYSAWDITADYVGGSAGEEWTQADADAGRCTQGQVGEFKNQHAFFDRIPMPSLADLTLYEQTAISQDSWIKIGDQIVCGPVLGDDAGEKQHLYLKGTEAAPIWVNGLVVVRGSVIISGVVKGQGSVYAGGNIYVPKDLTYENGPAPLPADHGETVLETWLANNQNRDSLGLFAGEHIVVGDYTDGSWRYEVNSSLDGGKSKEDAGLDCIPDTKAGRDGSLGTEDDDVLEDDSLWTVDYYTQEDADQGLIPPGKAVGDAVPGSGEDTDADGEYDGAIVLGEFTVPESLNDQFWAGNAPSVTQSYSEIASMEVERLDAAFYTNHAFALATEEDDDPLQINGCVISRSEAITYGAQGMVLNYDYRLMGGGEGFGFYLPKTWQPIEVVMWTSD